MPRDVDIKTQFRAALGDRARRALAKYANAKGERLCDDTGAVLIDFLTDLLHWIDTQHLSYPAAYQIAFGNYLAEKVQYPDAVPSIDGEDDDESGL